MNHQNVVQLQNMAQEREPLTQGLKSQYQARFNWGLNENENVGSTHCLLEIHPFV